MRDMHAALIAVNAVKNPAGKPKGTRNRSTIIREWLLENCLIVVTARTQIKLKAKFII